MTIDSNSSFFYFLTRIANLELNQVTIANTGIFKLECDLHLYENNTAFLFGKYIFISNAGDIISYHYNYTINNITYNFNNIISYDINADESTTGLLIGTTIKKYSL